MDALKKEELYTTDDIYALPNDVHAELFDGRIYYMSPPGWRHQSLSGYLYTKIYNYIDSKNGECQVLAAPFGVFLNKDNRNYYEPDISVICDLSKLDEQGCHGAPDWIIEIVSPSSKSRDCIKKMLKYGTAGVREYWIVDPEEEQTTVYQFENGTMKQYAFGEDVPVGIYEGFAIKIE